MQVPTTISAASALFLCRALIQSHLGKRQPSATTRGRRSQPQPATAWPGCLGSACKHLVLLVPVERQIDLGEPRRGERDGLAALQDRLNQLRPQEREIDQTPDVAAGDAFTDR